MVWCGVVWLMWCGVVWCSALIFVLPLHFLFHHSYFCTHNATSLHFCDTKKSPLYHCQTIHAPPHTHFTHTTTPHLGGVVVVQVNSVLAFLACLFFASRGSEGNYQTAQSSFLLLLFLFSPLPPVLHHRSASGIAGCCCLNLLHLLFFVFCCIFIYSFCRVVDVLDFVVVAKFCMWLSFMLRDIA